MAREKKELTAEQIYRQNKRRVKVFGALAPVTKWLFLFLALLFFLLMAKNSIGNITEILHLLDKDAYTGEQIAENYKMLVEKWGEWEIVGENTAGLVIRYVDIRNALFSGLMVTYLILTLASLLLSIVLGKVVFPQLVKLYSNNNDEMVNLATLKSAQKIDEITSQKGKEWF